MNCLIFGHAPSADESVLRREIMEPVFTCRRCSREILWANMPKTVRQLRNQVRAFLASRTERADG